MTSAPRVVSEEAIPVPLRQQDQWWRCPQCHGPLAIRKDSFLCRASSCRLEYPVVDGIPVMLIDQAQQLTEDAWTTALALSATAAE